MTATKLIHEEIKRFLKGTTPETLCITGKWGVGKTYLWKRAVLTAQKESAVGLKRYAYVSLFGQNSLADFKSAIVEETVDVGTIGKLPDIASASTPFRWKSSLIGLSSRIASAFPGIRDYVIDASRLLFSVLVRNQLICIDDLERVGSGLSAKDVLGLISFLKEEKGCRVVLLLNQDELKADDKDAFSIQVEKVIDTRLVFQPNPDEAAKIVIGGDTEAEVRLLEYCQTLGMTNIRVIQKIKRLVERLEQLLAGYDFAVLQQAIHSVTLLGWMVYQPTEAPSLTLLTDYDPWKGIANKNDEPSAEEKAWRALIARYKFTRIDEFDHVILDGVKAGFFDEEHLQKQADLLMVQVRANQQNGAFRDAWKAYHSSFNMGADEVLAGVEAAFRSGIQTITPIDLSGTVTLFKQLEKPDTAKAFITLYIDAHKDEGRDFFDLRKYPFSGEIKDADVRKAFEAHHSTYVDTVDPQTVLQRLSENSGWNPEDLQTLANTSVDKFVDIFMSSDGEHIVPMIQRALEFGKYTGGTPEMEKIASTATDALRRIASQSPINAMRVARFGISPEQK